MSVVFVFLRARNHLLILVADDGYLPNCLCFFLLLLLTLALFLSFGSETFFLREDRTALDATQPVRGGKLLARHEPRLFYASLEKYYEEEKKKKKKKKKRKREGCLNTTRYHPEVINPCGKEWNAEI